MRLLIALAAGWVLAAQPADLSKTIELRGTITKVAVEPRQGPRLIVKADAGGEWTVWLGSFRYLLEQDFNPRAGQPVHLRGAVREKTGMIAYSITMKDTGRTLELRTSDGSPLWRGQGMRPASAAKPDRPRP